MVGKCHSSVRTRHLRLADVEVSIIAVLREMSGKKNLFKETDDHLDQIEGRQSSSEVTLKFISEVEVFRPYLEN